MLTEMLNASAFFGYLMYDETKKHEKEAAMPAAFVLHTPLAAQSIATIIIRLLVIHNHFLDAAQDRGLVTSIRINTLHPQTNTPPYQIWTRSVPLLVLERMAHTRVSSTPLIINLIPPFERVLLVRVAFLPDQAVSGSTRPRNARELTDVVPLVYGGIGQFSPRCCESP